MRIILFCATLCAACLPLQALVEVGYYALPGQRDLIGLGNAPLGNGEEVRVGTFEADFDVAANADDLGALSRNWIPFDNTTTRTLQGEVGRFSALAESSDDSLDGLRIYLWILSTPTADLPDASLSNVDAYGLFSGSIEGTRPWRFKASQIIPIPTTVSVDDASVAYHGQVSSGALSLAAVPADSSPIIEVPGEPTTPSEEDDRSFQDAIDNSTAVLDNWLRTTTFGLLYHDAAYPGWFYSGDIGWFYAFDDEAAGFWMYLPTLGWLYSTVEIYPYTYSPSEGWLYLGSVEEQTDGQFYDFGASAWKAIEDGF